MFERIGSATAAQAEADQLKSIWSLESALTLRVVIYCAFKLEEILREIKNSRQGHGGMPLC
jgi:hypothetical protein